MSEQASTPVEQKKDDEYHVASFIAHAMSEKIEEVRAEIVNTTGAEIHAQSPEGKIVFTLEASSHGAIGKNIDKIRLHTGILSLSPVYHQYLNETNNA